MSSSPAPLGTLTSGLDALLHRSAFAPISNVGWLRITGSDRVRWLNGMVTNNIAALKPGEGCYNFFLNAQGRIQGDCTAWMQNDSILLQTAADRIPALTAMLDHFIIMDDVELHTFAAERLEGLVIAGPSAGECLPFKLTGNLKELCFFQAKWHSNNDGITVLRESSPSVPRYEMWTSQSTNELEQAIQEQGELYRATPEDLEALRILSGTPLCGQDIRDKDLPQETNQDTRALHFAKGCYLGQEIVERIRSRGAVHRTFTGFLLEGDVPQSGAPLTDDQAKPIGELTSIARIGDRTLALGYIRREVLARSSSIQYPGGVATPSELPFSL